jgi:DNA repair protein RecO (recombination protein O)
VSTEKSEAIVLRAVPWSETSLVVTLWTLDFGKVSAIAKGARRLRSPFESALDLLAHSSVVFIAKAGDALDLLTEAKLIRCFRSGRRSLLNLHCGYYVAELLLTMTEEGSAIPELFSLTKKTLVDLDELEMPGECLVRFEWEMLRLLGHIPSLENCVGCGQPIRRVHRIAFGIEAGGVLCSDCLAGQRSIVRIQPATIDYLTGMLENAWDTIPLKPIEPSIRSELRGLMNRYFSALSHRRFELHSYLEALARRS